MNQWVILIAAIAIPAVIIIGTIAVVFYFIARLAKARGKQKQSNVLTDASQVATTHWKPIIGVAIAVLAIAALQVRIVDFSTLLIIGLLGLSVWLFTEKKVFGAFVPLVIGLFLYGLTHTESGRNIGLTLTAATENARNSVEGIGQSEPRREINLSSSVDARATEWVDSEWIAVGIPYQRCVEADPVHLLDVRRVNQTVSEIRSTVGRMQVTFTTRLSGTCSQSS